MKTDNETRLREVFDSEIDSICDMVAPLMDANATDEAQDEAREEIMCDPLSIEFRSRWGGSVEEFEAEEFRILLAWGGPAVQIVGQIGRFGEAESYELQVQDWFQPWTTYPMTAAQDEALRVYLNEFYLGE
ncbi:hypothetical protein GQE99_06610 [Maritimibacter sp. DP07]|uniref:Uncharacterized protein n=1 Tax=Maritimibacter harenae TaxID=2606218 RepID=A0A845M8Q4_9RHOB|nr:hypothetical protein [Maritimibacter harenae]MZR12691.1 hypothetical protein [Maritimibacter harenae]